MSSVSMPSLKLPESGFFVGRTSQLTQIQDMVNKQGICFLVPSKGIFCPIGKTALAKKYTSGRKNIVWLQAKNKETLLEELKKIQQVFDQKDSLIILDGIKDIGVIQSHIPPSYQCHILVTSRQQGLEKSAVEVGPLLLDEAIDFLYQSTGKQDAEAATKIAEALDCLPASLEKAATLILNNQAQLEDYFGLQENQLDLHAKKLKQIGNLSPRNKSFVGREIALANLEDALKTNNHVVVTGKRKLAAKTGLGGMGKTQIALQYAYRNADKYHHLVFWINSGSKTALELSYAALAKKLGVFLLDEEKKEKNALIKKTNRALEHLGGYLLIYDNTDNQSLLIDCLPKSGGHVLITSRNPHWDLDKLHVFEIGVFKRKESIALIQKMTLLTHKEADQIAEAVKDLPIAVAQAAAYIKQVKITADEYLKRFEAKSKELFTYQKPTDEFSKTVSITWQISMEKIAEIEKKENESLKAPFPIAALLMQLCSFFDSRNIPQNLLSSWIEKTFDRKEASMGDLMRTLGFLRDFSMIDWEEKGISIHPIVQLVTRNGLKENELQEKCSQSIQLLHEIFKYDEVDIEENKNSIELITHAERAADQGLALKVEIEKGLSLTITVGHHLLNQGAYGRAKQACERCLEIAQDFYSNNAVLLAGLRSNLGAVLRDLSQYEEAKEQCAKALEIYGKAYLFNRPETASARNNLGNLLRDLSQYKEAKEQYAKALEIYEKAYLPNHPKIAEIRTNLGNVLWDLSQYAEAKEQYTKALEIYEKAYPPNHPKIADTRNNLGAVLKNLIQYKEAKEQHIKALEIYEKVYPSNHHPAMADIRVNLGNVLLYLSQYTEAEEQYIKALEIYEKASYPPTHPSIAGTRDNLGIVLRVLSQYEEAKKQHTKALEIYEKVYPPTHPSIANTRGNLGNLLQNLSQYEEAKEQYIKALKIYEKAYPPTHPSIANIRKNLGRVFIELGQYEEAKREYVRALEIYEKTYPPNDPTIAETKTNLFSCVLDQANQFFEKGSLEEAINKYQESLSRSSSCRKEVVVSAYHNLGCCYHIQGKLEKAKNSLEKATKIHPNSAIFCELGQFFYKQGYFQESIDSFLSALSYADNRELSYGKLEINVIDPDLKTKIMQEGQITVQASWLAYKLLAQSYLSLKHPETALSICQEFEEKANHSKNPMALYLLNCLWSHFYSYFT